MFFLHLDLNSKTIFFTIGKAQSIEDCAFCFNDTWFSLNQKKSFMFAYNKQTCDLCG
jgi:hypothetical protein